MLSHRKPGYCLENAFLPLNFHLISSNRPYGYGGRVAIASHHSINATPIPVYPLLVDSMALHLINLVGCNSVIVNRPVVVSVRSSIFSVNLALTFLWLFWLCPVSLFSCLFNVKDLRVHTSLLASRQFYEPYF